MPEILCPNSSAEGVKPRVVVLSARQQALNDGTSLPVRPGLSDAIQKISGEIPTYSSISKKQAAEVVEKMLPLIDVDLVDPRNVDALKPCILKVIDAVDHRNRQSIVNKFEEFAKARGGQVPLAEALNVLNPTGTRFVEHQINLAARVAKIALPGEQSSRLLKAVLGVPKCYRESATEALINGVLKLATARAAGKEQPGSFSPELFSHVLVALDQRDEDAQDAIGSTLSVVGNRELGGRPPMPDTQVVEYIKGALICRRLYSDALWCAECLADRSTSPSDSSVDIADFTRIATKLTGLVAGGMWIPTSKLEDVWRYSGVIPSDAEIERSIKILQPLRQEQLKKLDDMWYAATLTYLRGPTGLTAISQFSTVPEPACKEFLALEGRQRDAFFQNMNALREKLPPQTQEITLMEVVVATLTAYNSELAQNHVEQGTLVQFVNDAKISLTQ